MSLRQHRRVIIIVMLLGKYARVCMELFHFFMRFVGWLLYTCTCGYLAATGDDLVKNEAEDDQVDADDDDHGQEVSQVDHRVVETAS